MNRTSVVLDEALKENLRALARKQGVTMGSVIRSSLIAYLQKHGLKPFEMPTVDVGVGYD